jgi:hypothetical protein
MRLIRRIKAWFRKKRAERKLSKSGYATWMAYKHNRDPDVIRYANFIDDFYTNYPYVYVIKDTNHFGYKLLWNYGPGGQRYGFNEMVDWCEDKIRWNYRCDIHRVWDNYWGKSEFNDIGGSDYVHFAFKHEKDYIMFLLRWT